MTASRLQAFWNHPAGPKTIFFWAPAFKWGLTIANVVDFEKPPDELSYPQQTAVAASSIIWTRYSTVITPKNWNLFGVSLATAGTCLYQISRKLKHDYSSEARPLAVNE
ncbi:PREDICTED: mitochondrial pyruvate carrier 4-like [Tarenaya hassleriana]|uniref:mitochondrial pyruvate carrier 4-like n=1 Tax=Tarenaya hassleriana TaxID=28532 RepID=UPI00053C1845|nr:PREDICTED: mitochondrial pyruvate carrier 4-like [Tarenaya hassleriana]